MITQSNLDSYLGKSMSDICLNGFDDTSANHCAHFVSHALNLHFGYTCKAHRGGTQPGANLRVHEIFAQCPQKQEINQTSPTLTGIIFVSKSSNFSGSGKSATLRNIPKKHVGILLNGNVWHYGNTLNKVVKQPMSEFLFHYRGQTNSMWHGTLPAAARAIAYGQC